MECSKYEGTNNYLIKRVISQTCELQSPVKAAILNIENKVQELQSKVDKLQNTVADIANLLKKPNIGKLIRIIFIFDIPFYI